MPDTEYKNALRNIVKYSELETGIESILQENGVISIHALRADTVFPEKYGNDAWALYAMKITVQGIQRQQKNYAGMTTKQEIARLAKQNIASKKDVTSFHAFEEQEGWQVYILTGLNKTEEEK